MPVRMIPIRKSKKIRKSGTSEDLLCKNARRKCKILPIALLRVDELLVTKEAEIMFHSLNVKVLFRLKKII
jgi:hypothetical protein